LKVRPYICLQKIFVPGIKRESKYEIVTNSLENSRTGMYISKCYDFLSISAIVL